MLRSVQEWCHSWVLQGSLATCFFSYVAEANSYTFIILVLYIYMYAKKEMQTNCDWPSKTDGSVFYKVARPSRSTIISVHSEDGSTVYQVDAMNHQQVYFPGDNTMQFVVPVHYLWEMTSYYVLMESGAARTATYCGIESDAIQDPDTWTFTVTQGTVDCWMHSSLTLNWMVVNNKTNQWLKL